MGPVAYIFSKLESQIEGKSIKNQCKNRSKDRCLLRLNFDAILIDFSVGKWRHVGTKIESKIDVNFERPILQKVLKNQKDFSDFFSFGGRS